MSTEKPMSTTSIILWDEKITNISLLLKIPGIRKNGTELQGIRVPVPNEGNGKKWA